AHQDGNQTSRFRKGLAERKNRWPRITIAEKADLDDVDASCGHIRCSSDHDIGVRRQIADRRAHRQPAITACHNLFDGLNTERTERSRCRILAIDNIRSARNSDFCLARVRHAAEKGELASSQTVNHSAVPRLVVRWPSGREDAILFCENSSTVMSLR